jgi:hypothetical protein
MHRETIAKLMDVQRAVEQLLALLKASEHDNFAVHVYQSRREYRSAYQRAGKGGKQIERCTILTFQVAGEHALQRRLPSMGTPAADWRLTIFISLTVEGLLPPCLA